MLNVEEIINSTRGKLLNGKAEEVIMKYSIDTRELKENDFFIPLKGKLDGNDHILSAVQQGCCGFLVDKDYCAIDDVVRTSKQINPKVIIIEVKNTNMAFQQMAYATREKNKDIPVIAVTGSVGKTSMREMISSVLRMKYKVLTPIKNYNNHIGLPITLLELGNYDIAVLEMGMNHRGEISNLSRMAEPNIGVITNIGTAHIGNLGSIEEIYNAKMEIIDGMDKKGMLYINGDNSHLKEVKLKNITIQKFGTNTESIGGIYYGKDKTFFDYTYKNRTYEIVINEIGAYHIENCLCAIKIGLSVGLEIEEIIEGISRYHNVNQRMQRYNLNHGITLIDDSYNASLESMKAGLDNIVHLDYPRKTIVLGDMQELGDYSRELHMEVGKYIVKQKYNYDYIFLYGQEAQAIDQVLKINGIVNVYWFDSKRALYESLKNKVKSNELIYFKASNGINLGEIVDNLVSLLS